jgi:hypothetical protein
MGKNLDQKGNAAMARKWFAAVGLLLTAASPAVADDLSGAWVISGPVNPTCRFAQSGNFFRGDCDGPGAKGMAFGVIDGKMVRWSWQWTTKAEGAPGAFEFGGEIKSDGTISGAMMGTTSATGLFTAKRQMD